MSINSKMTAIADKIRELLGISGTMGLDDMATHIQDANDEVYSQADLIAQIKAVLDGKDVSGGSGVEAETCTAEIGFWGSDGDVKCTVLEDGSVITKDFFIQDCTTLTIENVLVNSLMYFSWETGYGNLWAQHGNMRYLCESIGIFDSCATYQIIDDDYFSIQTDEMVIPD